MSTGGISPTLPLPADLRTASPERQAAWRTAASFEQLLVQQLLKPLTAGHDDDTTTALYAEEMPSVLAGAVMQGGGLGLAGAIAAGIDTGDGEAT
ncbi:MAG TPA: hypothetical protein VFB41_10060 [Solirubrobacteraceae bacterium]|nr:hypothetical protein [Solirubrobacteraceae bacterium]